VARRPLVALAAAPEYPDLVEEGPLILAALEDIGVDARAAVWSDPEVQWAAFDLVVSNGAWDNIHHVAAFLSWVDTVAALGVPVVNSPATLRWNLDKRYLRDLEAAGVPTVPTRWVEPDGGAPGRSSLGFDGQEVVVKPAVSGGGYRTARYQPHERDEAGAHVAALVGAGRTAMIQPYQPAVDSAGEDDLIFLGGRFSHAVHKGPMIRRGTGARDSLIDNQVITATAVTGPQLEVADRALAAAERLVGPTTYARVDMVERADGEIAVLELELLDPMLFFAYVPQAAPTFARVQRDSNSRSS
jgi:glutathione synthase/RimK-type ligase-like ATP-grasp enzyme